MKENKKYYWLKLKEDFFDEKYIKALRKLPDGDALTIVYLKMQLKSLKTEGIIQYDHILPSAEEELALVLDEDVNIVRLTLSAILNMGLVEKWENDTLYMVAMQNLIGSETAVAERVRKHREKIKMLHCNTDETNSNTYIEIEKREKRKEIELEKREDNIYSPAKAEQNIPYKEIIDYLNERIGSSYRHTTKKTKDLIKARFNEGFTLDDFKIVIDKKSVEWIKDKEMSKYLRPETLFGTKFESYLNQQVRGITTKDLPVDVKGFFN